MKVIAAAVILLLSMACPAAPTDYYEARKLLGERNFAALDPAFNEVQRQFEARLGSVADAERSLSRTFRVFYNADESTGPLYDAWVKAYPHSYAASLARGQYLTALAWKRRGPEYAVKISPQQWQAMHAVAKEANAELVRSLALTPKPVLSYAFLIDLAMMESTGRTGELLADARKLDPQAYYASRAYLASLRPQWGGSLDAMKAFVSDFRKSDPAPWKVNCLDALILDLEGSDKFAANQSDQLAAMTKAIELCPQAYRYNARGYLYRQQKQFDLAAKDYRGALALNPGDQWARSMLGSHLITRGDATEGVRLCREAAEQQEPGAYQCLAYAYAWGKGVMQSDAEELRWLERSAAAGSLTGMADLAGKYWRGEGVRQDKGKAVDLWRKAAEAGDARSRSTLKLYGFPLPQ